jgi:hypothetical protein
MPLIKRRGIPVSGIKPIVYLLALDLRVVFHFIFKLPLLLRA